jgi:DNA (cytosine-5)-methyltransferase 1
MLTYATVCSGVEAVSLAWEPLAMKPRFFSEIEAFPNKVLAARWPKVPNLGDMLKIDGTEHHGMVDVFWASFPCQDFSEAGKRKGVDGKHGILTIAGLNLVDAIDPPVFCFENVRGLLTQKDNAFGQFLGRLAGERDPLVPPGGEWTDAGYVLGPRRRIAWRVLDTQHFGLPQQRDRVFVVASPAASRFDPRAVLFERGSSQDALRERLRGRSHALPGTPGCAGAFGVAIRGRKFGQQLEERGPVANCLRASQGGSDKPQALVWADDKGWLLRNLTPVEAERLQGMPDGHTGIPGASDTDRYHAIGNSLSVPVVRWIGERVIGEWDRLYPDIAA